MLGDGQRDTGDVDFLEAIGADLGGGHVAGDGHQRNGIQICIGDAGDQIGGTGAGGCDDHAHLAGGSGIAVGSVRCTLLVGSQHVTDLCLIPVQGVIQVDDLSAGITEDGLTSLLDESSDDDVSAR